MASCRLEHLETFEIDRSIVRQTLAILQQYGKNGCEGLVLWLGAVTERGGLITRAFVPEQHPIRSESGIGYFVDGSQLFSLNFALNKTGLRLIAQVHSHPGRAYHSEADDRYAIVTAEGGFSLVVPDFGLAPDDPAAWAVYRLSSGCWRELDGDATRRTFRLREDR